MVVLVNYFFVIHLNDTHMYIVKLRNGTVKQQLKYLMEKKFLLQKVTHDVGLWFCWVSVFTIHLACVKFFHATTSTFSKFFKIKMFHPRKKKGVVRHACSLSSHNGHPSTECGLSCSLTWLSCCNRTCNRWSCRHWNKECNKMITVNSVLW